MLFEKKIREKKVSPYLLDVVGLSTSYFIISVWLTLLLSIIILLYVVIFGNSVNRFFLFLPFVTIIVGVMAAVSNVLFNLKRLVMGIRITFCSKNKEERQETRDVILLDYCSSPLVDEIGHSNGLSSFFKDIYFRCICFLSLPSDSITQKGKQLYFLFPPDLDFFAKNYKRYNEEYLAAGEPFNEGEFLNSIKSMQKYGNPDYRVYWYYISYTKAQELNRLFELVSPHLFQIVVDEENRVLKEFHPIPGREYPPEALECMEKINQMYP